MNIKAVAGFNDADLLPRLEIVNDERTVDINDEFPGFHLPHHDVDRRFDLHKQRYSPRFFVLFKRVLETRPELAHPPHLDLHHRRVQGLLVEIRELAGGENGVGVHHDDGAVLAVNESEMGVRVFGLHADEEHRLEAKIVLDVEVLHVQALHCVGRHLGLVNGVDVESQAAQDEDEDEEEAAAAA